MRSSFGDSRRPRSARGVLLYSMGQASLDVASIVDARRSAEEVRPHRFQIDPLHLIERFDLGDNVFR